MTGTNRGEVTIRRENDQVRRLAWRAIEHDAVVEVGRLDDQRRRDRLSDAMDDPRAATIGAELKDRAIQCEILHPPAVRGRGGFQNCHRRAPNGVGVLPEIIQIQYPAPSERQLR
jgi:hypothetical protein